MSNGIRVSLAVAVLMLLSAPGWATPATAQAHGVNKDAKEIQAYFQQCHLVHVCNGSFLVSQHGKIIYAGAIGLASSDAMSRLTPKSAFDIGSMSKQFTAAGIVRLEERGRLDIDDPVDQYLPGFPYQQITIRQLLTHTSGVPDVMPHYTRLLKKGDIKGSVELGDVVTVLKDEKLPLSSAPGTKWEYSNTGYVLLAKVIEAVSGKSYAGFLKQEFFTPLKMASTLVRTPTNEGTIARRARGFVASADGRVKPYDQVPHLFLYGAGGIYSTTADLLRWAEALQGGKVMSVKHWKEATHPTTLSGGNVTPYGFGLSLKASPLGQRRITHGGHWRAFKSELTLFPETDTVIVLLTNNGEDDSVEDARDAVEKILAGRKLPVVAEPFQWQLADHVASDNSQGVKTWLQSVLEGRTEASNLAENDVNDVGYALLARKSFDMATAVFEFNHLAHPHSENALDSLADAYVATGETNKARAQLEAILALNQNSEHAKKRLADLPR